MFLFDEPVDVLEHDDRIVDHDADRQREREHGHQVQREPHVPDQSERRDNRGRDRNGRDDRRSQIREEQQHDQCRQNGPDNEVLFDVVDGGFDEIRRVAHDPHRVAGRQRRFETRQSILDRANDFHGVGAGLPPDLQQHRADAVDVRERIGLRLAVLHARHVADANGMAFLLSNDDVGEFGDGLHATARAQRDRLRSLIDAAPGDLDVLRLQCAGDVGDRQVVRAEPIAVEPDVDLPLPSAEHDHLADAVDAFQLAAQHFVRVLRDVSNRLLRAQREAEHGRGVGIHLVDARLLNGFRQPRQHAVQLVAHFLRGDVGLLLEDEGNDHLGDPFGGDRSQIVDSANRVDRFFDLVGDFRLDLLRCRTRLHGRHEDGGEVDLRETIDPEPREREQTDDAQRENEDAGEHRTLDAKRCEPLHISPIDAVGADLCVGPQRIRAPANTGRTHRSTPTVESLLRPKACRGWSWRRAHRRSGPS